jgi:protein-S-isoprenylcysteine O-methyltransferase Ste14
MTTLTAPRPTFRPGFLLDVGERLALLVLFIRMIIRTYAAVLENGHWFNWLLILSEGLGLLFIFIRKPAGEISDNPSDWTIAFFATAGPLLVHPAGFAPLVPAPIGIAFLSTGILIQLSAKLCLGRSFGIVQANRGVKRGGPYRYVRHPMYLGYMCVQVGFLILTPSLWNLTVYGVSFGCQLVRILAEERLLSQDPSYVAFKAQTRYRILPGVF